MHKQKVSIVPPEEDMHVKLAILPVTRTKHPTQLQRVVYRSLHRETRARRDLGRRHQDDDRHRGDTRRDAGIMLRCLTRMSKI